MCSTRKKSALESGIAAYSVELASLYHQVMVGLGEPLVILKVTYLLNDLVYGKTSKKCS